MAVPQSMDRQTFLAYLLQSGLLSKEEIQRLLPTLPPSPRGRVLARALVERGVLTRFQAERLLVGRTAGFLLGQYCVLEQIGRGGMGRVYKARHRTMGRVVALKVLAQELLQNERAVHLFLREVRAASQLAHPNIVTAYDANHAGGRYFLVLEFVDGPNLDQLVRQQGPLEIGLACDYIRQTANGLQCAHLLGMVHRDIKPANILVQSRGLTPGAPGLVKISDFGLARLQAPDAPVSPHGTNPGTILARENTVMGTPDFLSPEQCRNVHKTDIRSDLYSLGATFYYLLTGQVLFPGNNALEKLIRHNTERPTPVRELRPEVPEPVANIVHKLLAKHPKERFQTPAELAAVLEPYAVSGSTPWAPYQPEQNLDFEEVIPIEDPPSGVGSSDELSALAGTIDFERGESRVEGSSHVLSEPCGTFEDASTRRPPVSPPEVDESDPIITPTHLGRRGRRRKRGNWMLWTFKMLFVTLISVALGLAGAYLAVNLL